MTRIVEIHMLWIGVHRTNLLPYIVGGVGEVDAVAE